MHPAKQPRQARQGIDVRRGQARIGMHELPRVRANGEPLPPPRASTRIELLRSNNFSCSVEILCLY